MRGEFCKARETVAIDTPNSWAMSFIVIGDLSLISVFSLLCKVRKNLHSLFYLFRAKPHYRYANVCIIIITNLNKKKYNERERKLTLHQIS